MVIFNQEPTTWTKIQQLYRRLDEDSKHSLHKILVEEPDYCCKWLEHPNERRPGYYSKWKYKVNQCKK